MDSLKEVPAPSPAAIVQDEAAVTSSATSPTAAVEDDAPVASLAAPAKEGPIASPIAVLQEENPQGLPTAAQEHEPAASSHPPAAHPSPPVAEDAIRDEGLEDDGLASLLNTPCPLPKNLNRQALQLLATVAKNQPSLPVPLPPHSLPPSCEEHPANVRVPKSSHVDCKRPQLRSGCNWTCSCSHLNLRISGNWQLLVVTGCNQLPGSRTLRPHKPCFEG